MHFDFFWALTHIHWIFSRAFASSRIASAHVRPISSHVGGTQDPTHIAEEPVSRSLGNPLLLVGCWENGSLSLA